MRSATKRKPAGRQEPAASVTSVEDAKVGKEIAGTIRVTTSAAKIELTTSWRVREQLRSLSNTGFFKGTIEETAEEILRAALRDIARGVR